MSETKMRVQASELAAIVAAVVDDGERFTFDRVQDGYEDTVLRAVFITDEEPVGVPLRREVDPLLDLVLRLAQDLADERAVKDLALSVKVQWTDDGAAARVTPQQSEAYMRRTGWTQTQGHLDSGEWWRREEEMEMVPKHPNARDYGRRMSDLIRTLADVEQRSPLAVWLDLLAEAT